MILSDIQRINCCIFRHLDGQWVPWTTSIIDMILFTLNELCRIIGVAPFELFVSLVSWLTFSILICVKLEGLMALTWAKVFIPLFINNGIHWYFTTIVFVRRLRLGTLRHGVVIPRYIASLLSIIMVLTTEILLVKRLEDYAKNQGEKTLYLQVFVPFFFWFLLLLIFYCAGCSRQHGSFQPVSFNNNWTLSNTWVLSIRLFFGLSFDEDH